MELKFIDNSSHMHSSTVNVEQCGVCVPIIWIQIFSQTKCECWAHFIALCDAVNLRICCLCLLCRRILMLRPSRYGIEHQPRKWNDNRFAEVLRAPASVQSILSCFETHTTDHVSCSYGLYISTFHFTWFFRLHISPFLFLCICRVRCAPLINQPHAFYNPSEWLISFELFSNDFFLNLSLSVSIFLSSIPP